jgi:hypothetical protein
MNKEAEKQIRHNLGIYNIQDKADKTQNNIFEKCTYSEKEKEK